MNTLEFTSHLPSFQFSKKCDVFYGSISIFCPNYKKIKVI